MSNSPVSRLGLSLTARGRVLPPSDTREAYLAQDFLTLCLMIFSAASQGLCICADDFLKVRASLSNQREVQISVNKPQMANKQHRYG